MHTDATDTLPASADGTDAILQVKNLTVGFDTESGHLTAVDGVSFTVPRGKTLGIVGESGSGKSVTAFAIMRLLPQPAGKITGGSVLFEGRELTTLPLDELRKIRGNKISMVFQEPMSALNPVHRIGHQISEVLRLHTTQTAQQARQRAIELLAKVGIPAPEARLEAYPHQLSGGMRQRVVIAMALACNPSLIICDEPTTALDVTIQAQILDLLKSLQKEFRMTIILITHDLGVIAENCDEVAVMYAGRIVERADVHTLFSAPLHAYTQALLRAIPALDSVSKTPLFSIEGMVPSLAELKAGCRFAPRSGRPYTDADLNTRPPFIELRPGHWVEASRVCVDALKTQAA
ncbi:MAG: ABC transporter ATP-binding protein [Puniceicoccales bacterium]|jgi:peptide/nickel transport system ATP-binding protein|nr:ABC transporter ATP-binding protein [Puniceicoccales bacterium]